MPRDPLRLTLFLLVVLSISRIHQHFSILATLRPALMLAALAVGIAVLRPDLLPKTGWVRTWQARAVISLGVVACLSALFGISLGRAGKAFLDSFSKVIALSLLLMATVRTGKDLYTYVVAFVIGCVILVWFALFVFGLQPAGGGMSRLSNLYTYDANDLGLVLLVGLALAAMMFSLSRGAWRIFSFVALGGMGAAIARSGSRGAFLGLVVLIASLVVLVDAVSLGKRLLFVMVVGLGLAVASPPGYWEQMRTILAPKKDYNWDAEGGRRHVAKRGLGYMKEYPLFGVGLSNFSMAEGTISPLARNWVEGDAGIPWMAPHNSYIEVGAELGGVGLILWVSMLFGSLIQLLRIRARLRRLGPPLTEDGRILAQAVRYLPPAMLAFATSATFVSFGFLDLTYVLVAFAGGTIVLAAQVLDPQRTASLPMRGAVLGAPGPSRAPGRGGGWRGGA